MPKRKRGDAGDGYAEAHNGQRREGRETEKKLQVVFNHGIARLLKTLQVARGFEGQKLSKRRKLAKDEKEKARLDAETAVLEELSLNDVAQHHLYKTLSKVKSIASSPSFPKDALAKGTGPNPLYQTEGSKMKMTVTARLYSSNPVKSVMSSVVEKVKDNIGVKIKRSAIRKTSDRMKGDTKATIGDHKVVQLPAKNNGKSLKPVKDIQHSPGLDMEAHSNLDEGDDEVQLPLSMTTGDFNLEGEEPPAKSEATDPAPDPTADGHDPDPDISDRFTSRLADTTSEEEEEEDDEDDIDEKTKKAKSQQKEEDPWKAIRASAFKEAQARRLQAVEQGSTAQEDEEGDKVEEPDVISPLKGDKASRKESSKGLSTSSTFITSLSGYLSNSDSAANTSDEEAAKIKQRKNKRGQKARRAIWERKYGSNANHVKKEGGSRLLPDVRAKKDSRPYKPSQIAAARAGDRYNGRERVKGPPVPMGANSVDVVKANKGSASSAASAKVHPSWEAAKKRKEQNQATAFQGKKMVFD